MRLLVTGGAGFIGANFIVYWLENHPDDEIVNLDLLTYAGNLENLLQVADSPNYRFIKGNILDAPTVESAMKGVDTVVHLAAETHVDRSIMGPEEFVKTNVEGTLVLLEAARNAGIKRFHHISTDEVFGSLKLETTDKFTVNTPYDPSSPYSASKAGSDHLVRAYHRTYGLPITISNCSNNFGPYQFPEKLIPLTITNTIEGKKIPIYGKGDQVRDWLFVDDHCRAIDLILQKGQEGKTYLVGGLTQDISNVEVVKKILRILNAPDEMIEYVTDRPGHDERYSIDWSLTESELGYAPQSSFDEYLRKTVEWYVTHQDWWKRVKSGEYQHYYEEQYGNR